MGQEGTQRKNNREYSGSFSRDGNGVNAVFPINILYDENTIYINIVLLY